MQKNLICLNSAQVIQNIIAVLNIRPHRIIVFTTDDVGAQLAHLKAALSLVGHPLQDENIYVIHPTRFNDIYSVYQQWLSSQSRDQEYILNATGGTKPMSFIACDVFRNLPNFSAIYVDSDKDEQLTRFYPQPYLAYPIDQFPSIETYLTAYGFRMAPLTSAVDLSSFHPLWEHCAIRFNQMNWLFRNLPRNPMGGRLYTSGNASYCENNLRLLANLGLIKDIQTMQTSGEFTITYTDHPAVAGLIMNNGWIEEYLAWTLKKMGLEEVIRGVKIIPPSAPDTFAEFDVIARKGARLFLFECKTGIRPLSQETVHMIESKVRMAAGVFAIPVFVSTRRELHGNQSERLRYSRIHTILQDGLIHLESTLEKILVPFVAAPRRNLSG